MMSTTTIARSVESGDFARLVDRLLANGRCGSRRAGDALRAGACVEVAALGLALQRLCELVYWPHPDGRELSQRLLRLQRGDGLFGAAHADAVEVLPGAAAALRGLIDWRSQLLAGDASLAIINGSIQRAWRGVGSVVDRLLRERSLDESPHALALSIVLWQLGDADGAAIHLRRRDLVQHIRSAAEAISADDVCRLAMLRAA